MTNFLRIRAAQINLTVGDVSGNSEKILEIYQQASAEGIDLVLTPELSLTGYPLEDFIQREDIVAHALEVAQSIAKKTGDTALIFGLPIRNETGHLFNSAYLAYNGKLQQLFNKTELPNTAVFDEQRYFTSGSEDNTFNFKGVNIGLAICEDIWHPNVAKAAKADGAQVLLSMNASPYQVNKQYLRTEVIQHRTADTEIPLLYLNLIGGQDELVFDGQSFTYQNGKLSNLQPMCEESVFDALLNINDAGCSFVDDGSVDALCIEEQIFKAVTLGTKDYFHKNGIERAVLGLSGGVDSALVLAIGVKALGAKNIASIMMPYDYTSDISIEDAQKIANNYKSNYRVVSIKPMVNAFLQANTETSTNITGVSLENLQSRIRGVQLMAVANESNAVVLSTGNKSEMAVGYCTIYGDMNGGFNPLKDIPKSMVFRICNWINKNADYDVIPERILTRPPSAELSPDQEDSKSLPPYDILDPIIEFYVAYDYSAAEIIAEGYDADTVNKIVGLIRGSEFKRRQAPPGPKVSTRSFTKAEWRQPLTNKF